MPSCCWTRQGRYLRYHILAECVGCFSLQVKYEPAAPVGSTAPSDDMQGRGKAEPVLFPHLYGTIDFNAVTREHAVERDGHSGEFLSIHDVT